MPLRYIPLGGWQYGKTGKVYKGKKAKEKARAQGQAIELSKLRKEGRVVERGGKIRVKAGTRARGYERQL